MQLLLLLVVVVLMMPLWLMKLVLQEISLILRQSDLCKTKGKEMKMSIHTCRFSTVGVDVKRASLH